MKKLLVITLYLLLFQSCDLINGNSDKDTSDQAFTGSLGSGEFWVIDLTKEGGETGYYYTQKFDLVYNDSSFLKIYLEKGKTESQSTIDNLANEFKTKAYGKLTEIYGTPSDLDGNQAIVILLYDIQDGFNGSGGFVGGYFSGNDMTSQDSWNASQFPWVRSNEGEILYIDNKQNNLNSFDVHSTIAHEFQHMLGHIDRTSRNNKVSTQLDTWISEGLAMEGEYLVYGQQGISDRFAYLTSSNFDKDRSLLHWDFESSLSNYALAGTYMNFVSHKVDDYNTFLKNVNNEINGDYSNIASNLGNSYSGTTTEKFNKAFYDYAVKGLYRVEQGIFPSITGKNDFSGITESSSKSYSHYGYVPTFLRYNIGTSLTATNASIMDISTGNFNSSSSISSLTQYASQSYGVVFLSSFHTAPVKNNISLSNTPLSKLKYRSKQTIITKAQRIDAIIPSYKF